jgi:hypothetical protein
MPRIPVYQERQQASQNIALPQAVSPIGGKAISAAGQMLEEFAKTQYNFELETAKAEAAAEMPEQYAEALQMFEQQKANAQPGAKDFVSTFAKTLDVWAEDKLKSASSIKRKIMTQSLAQTRKEVLNKALAFQVGEGQAYRKASVNRGIAASIKAIELDPTPENLQKQYDDMMPVLLSLDALPSEKLEMTTQLEEGLAESGAKALAERNPGLLLAQYERGISTGDVNQSNPFLAKLPPEKVDGILKIARANRDTLMVNDFSANGKSPTVMLADMASGQVGEWSAIWELMSPVEQDAVKNRYVERVGQTAAVKANEEKLVKKENERKAIDLREQYYRGQIGANALISQLKELDELNPAELKSILKGDEKEDNYQLIGRLESMVDRGQLGEAQIDEYANNGTISWKSANALKRQARSGETPMRNAERYIDNALGVPDPLTPGFTANRLRAAEVKNQLRQKEYDAAQKGQPFDSFAEAQSLVSGRIKQEDIQAIKESRDQLRLELTKNGLQYSEDYNKEDLEKAGLNKMTVDRVLRLLKAVRG